MIIAYILTIFLCFFVLYVISRHDFVLLRQSISLRQVFDKAFIALLISFLFARVFYALYNLKPDILNPLRFLYLTKYPGVLLPAGIVGGLLAILVLYRKKKNKLRILDITMISFFPIMLLDTLLKPNDGISFIIKAISFFVLLVFYIWFVKIHNQFTTKDGFILFLSLLIYALVSLALSFANDGVFKFPHVFFQGANISMVLISSVFLILIQINKLNKQ